MEIEKTVVGSFPKTDSPLEKAIREIVNLQLCYGIDVITDGELRCNMIQYFDQIPGLQRFGEGLRIVGKIEPMEEGKIDEFYKIKDYETVKSILKNLGKKSVKIKITITGPMKLGTLCASTDIENTLEFYNLDNEEATWFIDPPYQFGGEWYVKSTKDINFTKLAEWCMNRNGQVIVCENTKADWLPFKPMKEMQGAIYKTTEAIWSNHKTNYDHIQQSLWG